MSPDALRHPRFDRPFHGVRAIRADDHPRFPSELARERALKLVPRLRAGEAFSHVTALVLLGCPIQVPPEPHVIIALPASRSVARGVIGHTSAHSFSQWKFPTGGARFVPPTLAFTQSASLLPLVELVVAADHLLGVSSHARGSPIVTLGQLEGAARSARSAGISRARAALNLARVGAESRMETLLRLVLAEYGLDVFELQADVHDERGVWIGRFDMVDRERKIIVEYDGEQHRLSDAQYERDAVRLERAREAGYLVLRFRHRDVLDTSEETAGRVARALGVPLRLRSKQTQNDLRPPGAEVRGR